MCCSVAGTEKTTLEFASGPPKLRFESPPPAMELPLLLADEPTVTDDNAAISSLRAGPKQKNVEISTTPRYMVIVI